MNDKSITLRFYEELNDFLPPEKQKTGFTRKLFLSPAVKDVVEAEGVPHTEVDLVLVNGESVGWEHRLLPGDRVAVYPEFESLDISPLVRLRPQPLRNPCFVLDVHLGGLARRLRLLGFDCWYRNDYKDEEIIEVSVKHHRIILTRDKGILKNRRVSHGCWLHSDDSDRQLREVIERFDLVGRAAPFSRCSDCNGLLETVKKSLVLDRIPVNTAAAFDTFYRCSNCGKIYWKGSHYEDMLRRFSDILGQPAKEENQDGEIPSATG